MSNFFRFSEFLEEKLWNKVVSDLKTFVHKWCKIAAQKKSFLGKFCLTSRIFLVSVLLSASVERFFVSHMQDFLLMVVMYTCILVVTKGVVAT